jgi:hypothetical protein
VGSQTRSNAGANQETTTGRCADNHRFVDLALRYCPTFQVKTLGEASLTPASGKCFAARRRLKGPGPDQLPQAQTSGSSTVPGDGPTGGGEGRKHAGRAPGPPPRTEPRGATPPTRVRSAQPPRRRRYGRRTRTGPDIPRSGSRPPARVDRTLEDVLRTPRSPQQPRPGTPFKASPSARVNRKLPRSVSIPTRRRRSTSGATCFWTQSP